MADEQPLLPVFRLTAQTPYEVTTEGGLVKLRTDFAVLEGDADAFGALARAAGRTVWAVRDDSGDLPSRPLYIPTDVKTAAEKKAKREHRSLSDVLKAGYAKYLEGGIEPVKPVRAPRRAPGDKPVKALPSASLRISDEDWEPIEARCKADKERLKFLVNPSRVITQYLREDYLAGELDQE
ncbi:hypothetical protein PV516_19515 [Streptomyces scabiei]|uniref:hypothetical protein n=1 Tax=Streptomyces scabiei TaxID=1930 RepID=UPI0029ADEE66|nr:hypothetical protein [Streptomyces scabiei]MDX3165979.1 hypothetical protein [Streptomyces scabiei]